MADFKIPCHSDRHVARSYLDDGRYSRFVSPADDPLRIGPPVFGWKENKSIIRIRKMGLNVAQENASRVRSGFLIGHNRPGLIQPGGHQTSGPDQEFFLARVLDLALNQFEPTHDILGHIHARGQFFNLAKHPAALSHLYDRRKLLQEDSDWTKAQAVGPNAKPPTIKETAITALAIRIDPQARIP